MGETLDEGWRKISRDIVRDGRVITLNEGGGEVDRKIGVRELVFTSKA